MKLWKETVEVGASVLTGPNALCYPTRAGRLTIEREPVSRFSATFGLAGARLTVETLAMQAPLRRVADIQPVFDDLAGLLAAQNRTVLYEKAFGALECAEEVAACRDRAFAEQGVNLSACHTFIEGRPCHGGSLAGLQVWTLEGSSAKGLTVTQVDRSEGASARIETGCGTVVVLSGVTGTYGDPEADHGEAFSSMFESAERLLAAHGLSFRNVARTWLYIPNLLEEYTALNDARSAFFRMRGLVNSEGGVFLPASTAVEGRHSSGAPCVLDLLAIAPAEFLTPVTSTSQGPAFEYGSAFSRGMLVAGESPLPGGQASTVFVSGTASIDSGGRSIHVGDRAGQIRETYRTTGSMLQQSGCFFDDVAMAVRYYSDLATWHAHKELEERGLLPNVPAIDVLSTICRSDLHFELEVTAVGHR